MSFSRAYVARLAYVDPSICLDSWLAIFGWMTMRGSRGLFVSVEPWLPYARIAFQESRDLGWEKKHLLFTILAHS